jgi:hypothetical protein
VNSKTQNSLLSRGFPTDLIARIGENAHTVAILGVASKRELRKSYSQADVETIYELIKRKSIPSEVVESIVSAAGGACCYCCDGNSSRPYQIHHIVPYCETQDNSEDNLLLICPTHHEVVPTNDSVQKQKSQRKSWQAIVQIATDFQKKGVPFSYERLIAFDFEHSFDPAEIIHNYRASPSLCINLSEHSIATKCVEQLESEHFAVIVGSSGSGKSTLAVGSAGRFAANHRSRVFQFRGSPSYSHHDLHEVLRCISCCSRRDVLILDDANKFLSVDDLVSVSLAARTKMMSVIATWTNDAEQGDVLQRNLPQWLLIGWEHLRNPVFRFLQSHEDIISQAIQSYRSIDDHPRIGVGVWDLPLTHYLERQDKDIRTASQFFYLLRGGPQTVSKELSFLVADARSDVPVLFSAIEQIAGFEKAVSVEETCRACRELTPSYFGSTEPKWVESIFEAQCRNGKMKKQLGMYMTIHRDFAKRLVSSAMANDATRDTTEQLLLRDFNLVTADPLRWAILASWFWYDDVVGPWIRSWAKRQSVSAWETLVANICKKDLSTIGITLEWLSMFASDHSISRETVVDLLSKNARSIGVAISSVTATNWPQLKQIAWSMQTEAKSIDLITPSLKVEECVTLLEQTSPDYYDDADWFFGSVEKLNREWVLAVGSLISADRMSTHFRLAKKGNLKVFFRFLSLMQRLKKPLKRSDFKEVTSALHHCLAGAKISELELGFGDDLVLTLLFPEDCRYIMNAIDLGIWAQEIEQSNPREWRNIVGLFSLDSESQVLNRIHNELDHGRLVANIKTKYKGHEYEMRCFLWFLRLAEETRREWYLTQLLDVIRDSFSRIESERSFLFKSVSRFDRTIAERLALDFGYVPTAEDREILSKGPSHPELLAIRKQLRDLDERQQNYLIYWERLFGEEQGKPIWEEVPGVSDLDRVSNH